MKCNIWDSLAPLAASIEGWGEGTYTALVGPVLGTVLIISIYASHFHLQSQYMCNLGVYLEHNKLDEKIKIIKIKSAISFYLACLTCVNP